MGEEKSRLVSRLESLEASPDNPLHQLPQIIQVPSEENRSNWSWVATYNPVPDIEKVKCPLLLMFRDQDLQHPTELAVKKWRKGLDDADNDQAKIMVFREQVTEFVWASIITETNARLLLMDTKRYSLAGCGSMY